MNFERMNVKGDENGQRVHEKGVLKLMKQAGGFIQQQVARDPRRRKRIHRRVDTKVQRRRVESVL